jgi:hypothetical protein
MARSVKSQLTLLNEINRWAPNRSKASDGWIGDPAHAARHSDHNAEPDGTVDARDYTHDPANGADMRKVWNRIRARRDPRVSYLIFEGQIMSGNAGPQPWVPRPYLGKNRHDKHLHVSVLDKNQDDTSPWGIAEDQEDGFLAGLTETEQKEVRDNLRETRDFVEDVRENVLKGRLLRIEEAIKRIEAKLAEK